MTSYARICSPGMVAVILAVVGLTACGGSAKSGAIARVGDATITGALLTHWMTVLAPQHVLPEPPLYARCIADEKMLVATATHSSLLSRCRQRYQTLRRASLNYLVSTDWLLGAAAENDIPISDGLVQARLTERERSYPAGPSEFQESAKAVDHTMADIRLEIEREVAAALIRQKLAREMPPVTAAEVTRYYERNIREFKHAERRRFYIVESINTAAEARGREQEFAAGKKHITEPGMSLLETRERPTHLTTARTILKAIFAATPDVISPPIRVERYYFLIDVVKVTRATVQPLRQVRSAIARKLTLARLRRTLARFATSWAQTWRARTDCMPGYVVSTCRQYVGAPSEYGALGLA
ncbi:MAG: peptidyl-prolyl cis-trans isomerase [Phenylobacterium sp.]|nr:MAG: peptidyl-prolyl cis-trans isomerase [Phenylobacterium sp.]